MFWSIFTWQNNIYVIFLRFLYQPHPYTSNEEENRRNFPQCQSQPVPASRQPCCSSPLSSRLSPVTLLDSEVRLTGGAPSLSCLSREEPVTGFWRGRDCSDRESSFFTAWGLAAPGGHVMSRQSRVGRSCLSWLSHLKRLSRM